jgi:hypothetical protein
MEARRALAYPLSTMKILVRIGIALALLVIVVLAAVLVFLDPLVKGGIEKGATYATGTETKLGSVDASLFSGRFGLKDLTIANPPGFGSAPFLHLGSAQAAWDNGTILSDDISIGTFALDTVELSLESNGGKTNYGAILDHLQQLSGPESKPAEASPSKSKKLSIKRIEIKNVKAALHLSGLPVGNGSMSVSVPRVAIDDFHSDGSTSEIVAKLTSALVHAILQGALNAGKNVFPADVLKDLSGNLQKIEHDLQGEAKELMKGNDPNVKGVEDALKNAGDFFKKKK